MQIKLHHEIEKLKRQMLRLGIEIEERVRNAVTAVEKRNPILAQKVIDDDITIDQKEVDLEEECLKILALHQPVALDLRNIIVILKINNDLERIGDIAVNIAERAVLMSKLNHRSFSIDFTTMAEKSQDMLKRSLTSFVNLDESAAYKVTNDDDEVDAINRQMYQKVKEKIREDIQSLEYSILVLDISRHLERIADHATNIAEDVIYLCRGEIIRHRTEDFQFLLNTHIPPPE